MLLIVCRMLATALRAVPMSVETEGIYKTHDEGNNQIIILLTIIHTFESILEVDLLTLFARRRGDKRPCPLKQED